MGTQHEQKRFLELLDSSTLRSLYGVQQDASYYYCACTITLPVQCDNP